MAVKKSRSVTLCISDFHAPFNHPKALEFLKQLKEEFNPTRIVCLGDEADLYRLSKYDHDPDALGANHEITLALNELKELFNLFPEAHACTSNHMTRAAKMAARLGVPSMFWRSIREWTKAPEGWSWRDHWDFDGVRYFHGEPFSSMTWRNACDKYRQSVVMGHFHAGAGTIYTKSPNKVQIFALNSGCLIDEDAYAFAYGKFVPSKPTIGTSVVLDNGKRGEFIPL